MEAIRLPMGLLVEVLEQVLVQQRAQWPP